MGNRPFYFRIISSGVANWEVSGLLGIQFATSVATYYGQLFCYYLDDVEHQNDSQCPSSLLD